MKSLTFKSFLKKNKGEKLLKKFVETSRETVVTYSKVEDGLPKKIIEKSDWD